MTFRQNPLFHTLFFLALCAGLLVALLLVHLMPQQMLKPLNPLHYFPVTEQSSELQQVLLQPTDQWQLLPGSTASLGYQQSSYWYKTRLSASSTETALSVQAPFLDQVELYVLDRQLKLLHSYQLGDRQLYKLRPLPTLNFVIPLPASTEDLWLFAKVTNQGANMLPLQRSSTREMEQQEHQAVFIQSLFSGIFSCLIALSAGLYLIYRHGYFLAFSGMFFTVVLIQLEINGLLFAYVWPNSPDFNLVIEYGAVLGSLFASVFMLSFFRTTDSPNWLMWPFQLIRIFAVLLLFASPWLGGYWLKKTGVELTALTGCLMLLASFWLLHKRHAHALFLSMALLTMLTGVAVMILRSKGYLPEVVLTNSAMEVGNALAALFFVFAMLQNLYMEKNKKIAFQQQILDQQQHIQNMQQKALDLALKEHVSDLPNKQALLNRLEQLDQQRNSDFYLVMIEHQRFRQIERALGVEEANHTIIGFSKLLKRWGEQQRQTEAQYPSLFALERDSYAVLIAPTDFRSQFELLRHQLDALLKVDNLQLDLGTVYSSVHYPADCPKAVDTLDLALAAIEHADRAGDYLPYEPLYLEHNLEHIHLLSELNIALQDDLLELYVQPILDMKQQKIHAAELLIRWYHPKMGQIAPDDFIPLAEQTGMISQVTEWVLDKSLILQKQLTDAGAHLRLSMNISPLDLRNTALISRVIEAVKSTSYSSVPLQLELTETAFVDLVKDSEQALKLLERSNIRISLDDFGVGQSSLARLQGLPLGELKIDRDLLCQAVRLNDDTVLRYAVMLGKSLQLYTVIEGVETLKELEFARRLGADAVQGYLLAKPMPFATFSQWLLDFDQQGFRLS
ncbi:EAL domain-containing protein [Rheinheimera soli]|uniref:EAL domain-containing protein (Putative c-di-GMP-specific phosphodiesterase class I)/GGDEF domain-containing protein n=1 Tax=Rheinheimera soli TaxID=443616 RepID=A0ABU1W1U5_9GAMM|nr:EAL domain-containing protein [Rheinheimera soli]MDR7121933.1 EAL domain-containing protein (putative c-di-GMP-specific phosphodiesterase class I)/GGDEF domain-containing protein [Rheinheimera soli]